MFVEQLHDTNIVKEVLTLRLKKGKSYFDSKI